ncbi:MAG: sulfite exporter TauE/SafE family protein [Magnetospirillum sp. WYHS-4]
MDAHAMLFDFVSVCRVAVDDHSGLILGLFLAGLGGSLTHCAGMCGPFVLAQVMARLEALPAGAMSETHRLLGAALVPYHLGRATTYAGLGALAAGLVDAAGFRPLAALLLGLAGLFFLGYGLRRLGLALPGLAATAEGPVSRAISRLAKPLFARPVGTRAYGLGVALGFLPCGLVWGALAAAASAGDSLGGAFAMLAFAVGTIPALLAVGLAGHVAGSRWRETVGRVAPFLLVANAALLCYMAWRMTT